MPHRPLAVCSLLLAAAAAPAAAAADGVCATLAVSNVRPGQGFLMVAAYADAATFGKTPVASLKLAAGDSPQMNFQLCGLGGASVAVTMYQDLDGDGRMGRNLLGMPTEPWGASGTPGAFGPSWETVRVALDGQPIAVRLSQ